MSSVYLRGKVWWCKLRGLKRPGAWGAQSTGERTEDAARRYASAAQRLLDERHAITGPGGMPTVAAYLARWTAERIAAGLRSADEDRRRLERHAMPMLGTMRLDEVRPRHIRDLVRSLRVGELAPRTQLHVFRSLHTMFESARIDELILANPVVVKPRELPKKRDKDPEWRSQATYATREVEQLISDTRIPVERRVQYALKAIAGLRHGEVAALRWRLVDRDTGPLGRLTIAWAFSSRSKSIKETKAEETRAVPIHPTLARILAAWRLSGWAATYGRAPGLDDLVVPTRNETPVDAADAGHAFKADLAALGLRVAAGAHRARGGHDLRGWYLTQTIVDGADPVLLRRTTHAAPTDVAGGYERYGWAAICREVAKLRVSILDGEVLALGTGRGTASPSRSNRWRKDATPTGFEGVSVSTRARSGDVKTRGYEAETHPSASPLPEAVPNRGTAPDAWARQLAEAVLSGDEVTARRLALEVCGLDEQEAEPEPETRQATP